MVLPKEMRIKGYKCFDYIHKASKRYSGPSMTLRVSRANPNLINGEIPHSKYISCRCAISISNKVSKKAVIRNRLRRLVHSHLKIRLFKKSKHINKWALLSFKPRCLDKEPKLLLEECDKLLLEAGFC